jgi:competence protein ComGC
MEKSWIIIGFTIVLVISSLVLIIGCPSMDSTQQSMAESWMFKGAYATYEGQIDPVSIPHSI